MKRAKLSRVRGAQIEDIVAFPKDGEGGADFRVAGDKLGKATSLLPPWLRKLTRTIARSPSPAGLQFNRAEYFREISCADSKPRTSAASICDGEGSPFLKERVLVSAPVLLSAL